MILIRVALLNFTQTVVREGGSDYPSLKKNVEALVKWSDRQGLMEHASYFRQVIHRNTVQERWI